MHDDPDRDWWQAHSVTRPYPAKDVAASFLALIDTNPPEREIQSFLERFPWILTEQHPHCHFAIPHFTFGDHYETDFLLPERGSGGTEYILVELKRPDQPLLTKGGTFPYEIQQAIEQIRDSRSWLLANLDMARRPRERGGLGLYDITRYIEGVLLVGRRQNVNERFNELRERLRIESSIQIETYDRMIEWAFNRAEVFDGWTAAFRSAQK